MIIDEDDQVKSDVKKFGFGARKRYFIFDEDGIQLQGEIHKKAQNRLSIYLGKLKYDYSKDVQGLDFHFKFINGNEF